MTDGLARGLPQPQFLIDLTEDSGVADPEVASARVRLTSPVVISPATFMSPTWHESVHDTHGFWDGATKFIIPPGQAGLYTIGGSIHTAPGAMYVRQLTNLQVNEVSVPSSRNESVADSATAVYAQQHMGIPVFLEEGDDVRMRVHISLGSGSPTLGSSGDTACGMWLTKMGSMAGPAGPPGGAVQRGVTFPADPFVQQEYLRTDIRGGTLFFWDGTYWLSRQVHHGMQGPRVLHTGLSASNYMTNGSFDGEYDCWLMGVTWNWYIASGTHNSSNHWGLRIWQTAPGGLGVIGTDFPTWTHSDTAVADWHTVFHPINELSLAAEGSGVNQFHFYAGKVGTIGALDVASPDVLYRLRAT
jgi:hypothetical protein